MSSDERLIDFTEIRDTAKGEGLEALARDLLNALGIPTVWTGRGSDGGMDLTSFETMDSVLLPTQRKWLVQSKHHAHSKSAVNEKDVGSITDLCDKHECDAYLLVTTTVPTVELVKRMHKITESDKTRIVVAYLDEHKLRDLLLHPKCREILKKHLPKSFKKVAELELPTLLEQALQEQGISEIDSATLLNPILSVLSGQSDSVDTKLSLQSLDADHGKGNEKIMRCNAAFKSGNDQLLFSALDELEDGEFVDLIEHWADHDGTRLDSKLHKYATQARSEPRRFLAMQLLQEWSYLSLDTAIKYMMPSLSKEVLEKLVHSYGCEELIYTAIAPHAADESPDLPGHAMLDEVLIEDVEYYIDEEQEALCAEVDISLHYSLTADGDEFGTASPSAKATMLIYSEDNVKIEEFTVDTVAFWKDWSE